MSLPTVRALALLITAIAPALATADSTSSICSGLLLANSTEEFSTEVDAFRERLQQDQSSGQRLSIVMSPAGTSAQLIRRPGTKTLVVPQDVLSADGPRALESQVLQLLVGSTLHPFIAAEGKPRILRPWQTAAISAARAAQANGDRRFLCVAPPGTGKTQVVTDILAERMATVSPGLHVVIADQILLTQRLEEDLRKQLPYQILSWGGTNGSQTIAELVATLNQARGPVILVTTQQSLKARLRDACGESVDPDCLAPLARRLRTLVYDETQHLGAPQTRKIVDELMRRSDAFLIGTTATPLHADVDIQQLYDGRAFWAYLDGRGAGDAQKPGIVPSLETILDQMKMAIDRGELTPFDELNWLFPEQMLAGKLDDMFISSAELNTDADADAEITGRPTAGYRLRLDAKAFPEIERELLPMFEKHRRGFISVATIEEANELADFLGRRSLAGRRVVALHSKLSSKLQGKIENQFREGQIDFLVTIRKLDEGLDYPDLTLYVDLNHSVGVRQMIQRIGRVLRLAPGKDRVDVAMLMALDELEARDAISFFDRTLRGDFFGGLEERERPDRRRTEYLSALGTLTTKLKMFWRDRTFLTQDQFLVWAAENKITSGPDFRARFGTSSKRPSFVPSNPTDVYQLTWSEITGNQSTQTLRRGMLSQAEFLSWAQKNRVLSGADFFARFSGANRPSGVPAMPNGYYKTTWPELTGVEHARSKSNTLTADEFLRWSAENGIRSEPDFKRRFDRENRPANIPADPAKYYGLKWSTVSGNQSNRERKDLMMSVAEFTAWARSNNILTRADFESHFAESGRPDNVPAAPWYYYKTPWREITGRVYHRTRDEILTAEEFLRWSKENKILSQSDFRERFGTSITRPSFVPSDPVSRYGLAWSQITGVMSLANRRANMLTLDGFLEWARGEGVKSYTDFRRRFGTKTNRPDDVPSEPENAYHVPWSQITERLRSRG